MPQIETLGPLRHICHASGGCCQGNVAMLKDAEEQKLCTQSQTLHIPNPVENKAIRKENGRCVFLSPQQLCQIHARFGEPEKPSVCRQFPLVAIHTEDEIRVGIDPGCLSAWKTWKDGPLVQPGALISTKHPVAQAVRSTEEQILDLLSTENASVNSVLQTITGSAQGFAQRWRTHLSKIDFQTVLNREGTAPIFQKHLCTLSEITTEGSIETGLSTAQEEWVLESVQRMIYLRFLTADLTPHTTLLICLGGALACAWSNPASEVFGPTFATWNRAIRSRVFLSTLLPEPTTLSWLVSGK